MASLLTLLTVSSHVPSGVGRPHGGTSSALSTPMHRCTTPCGRLGVCLWFDSQALWTQSSPREGSALRELLGELCLQSWRQGQPPPQPCSSSDTPCGFSCFVSQRECNTKTSLYLDLSGNPSRNGTGKKPPDYNHAIKCWITTENHRSPVKNMLACGWHWLFLICECRNPFYVHKVTVMCNGDFISHHSLNNKLPFSAAWSRLRLCFSACTFSANVQLNNFIYQNVLMMQSCRR